MGAPFRHTEDPFPLSKGGGRESKRAGGVPWRLAILVSAGWMLVGPLLFILLDRLWIERRAAADRDECLEGAWVSASDCHATFEDGSWHRLYPHVSIPEAVMDAAIVLPGIWVALVLGIALKRWVMSGISIEDAPSIPLRIEGPSDMRPPR